MVGNIAATTIRKQLRRHASGTSRTMRNLSYRGNGGPRETTPFLSPSGEDGGDSQSPQEDDRAWSSWPKKFFHILYATLASNYVNVLLVFVPLGIIAGAASWNPIVVFVLNFLAIIPLASLLSFATVELSVKLGETLGGLLNASFGNAVELIVSGMPGL